MTDKTTEQPFPTKHCKRPERCRRDDMCADTWHCSSLQPADPLAGLRELANDESIQMACAAEDALVELEADPAPHDAQSELTDDQIVRIFYPMWGATGAKRETAVAIGRAIERAVSRTSDRDAPFKPDWANYRQGLADGADRDAVLEEAARVCDRHSEAAIHPVSAATGIRCAMRIRALKSGEGKS